MIERSEINSLIEDNKKMIYKLANNFSRNNFEDLYQVGVIGLINAYNNYNKDYNIKFSTYAYTYILGEMKKYVRENKNIKISRDIIYLSNRLDKLIELLMQKYKRMPTTKELSIETGLDEWKIVEALGIKNCIKSLDEPVKKDEKEITMLDVISDNSHFEDDIEFEELLNTLNDEERIIIENRYFNDKSQSEVALLTGYSQSKISRKEEKILTKLRNYYERD